MAANLPDSRPDPDALLARVRREEARRRRGRLKIFFGAAAGVGKSYAMLEAARRQKADGADVVVGYVELHGRPETEALLSGLEALPPQALEHRGLTLAEFDLDASLLRNPQIIIVDELAHSNHPGARHPKRWMDIVELLDAGIDVYTTVNVQHVESLNDIVAQITGVTVRETIPDRVFDAADEVELVDLPPDDLLRRVREGKVYTPEKSRHALDTFFRKGNLIALRQLALRATAERVDAAMREYRDDHAISDTWAAGERVLVCVGPDPLSERLVRAARRLASALHAQWHAIYVETPNLTRLPRPARDRVLETLKLAESLGAQAANLSGESVAGEVLAFARQHNVSKIIVGKPSRPRWLDRFPPSLVDEIVRRSGHIDVYVITGEEDAERTPMRARLPVRTSRWPAYARSAAVVAAITVLCAPLYPHIERTNLVMLYLLGTVLTAVRFGRGPSVLAAILSVGLFDFLFVPPEYSFAVSDTQYLITFAVMLATGLIISNLAALGRRQASVARARERRAAELYALSRELAQSRDVGELGEILRRHLLAGIEGHAAVLLPDADGKVQDPGRFCARGASEARYPVPGNDLGIAQWAYDHREKAGHGTDTLASAEAIFLPLNALRRCIGVLALRPTDARQLDMPEQMHLVESLVNQTAIAMERVQLAQTAQAADMQIESERLRNVLLSSISHDFRTPLASIIGAASTLNDDTAGTPLDSAQRRSLLTTVLDEAQRLHRLVDNLLELTRLTQGPVEIKRQWIAIEEVVGSVLHRLRGKLSDRQVEVHLPADLPLLYVDEVLIEQVLFNLAENAQKHANGSAIRIGAEAFRDVVVVSVRDHGPGLPSGEETRVFEKFHRGRSEGAQSGFGLGLTICKVIVAVHGGSISAHNAPDGGAEFRFTLPRDAEPPA
ncbi:MAG TPA: sensor histidine kinase KdpD [Rudaea sp.]|jgi:two-component system sensor histidine kinase KdpD|uniref:sensor histidine kinase KdpD n=1 Tax=Rudaea sp. TaxID=2136325 RepID=UPI002F95B5D1